MAEEILKIFRVHREAIAALLLFRNAVEKDQVTSELVHRLQDYLAQARRDPDLRFAS